MDKPKDFFDTYANAVLYQDKKLMKSLYHKDIVMFDLWNKYYINGKESIDQIVDDWFDTIKTDRVVVEFSNIHFFGDTKVAHADAIVVFKAYTKDDKILRQIKERMTVCFVNETDNWYVINQHTSVPIEIESGKGIFQE
jgi:ketosteroid isomerase-like protein